MNRFDQPKNKRPIFPVTKVVIRPKVQPTTDPNVIRLRPLEGAARWYRALSFHQQAIIKTVILSFVLVWPAYQTVLYLHLGKAYTEILSKLDKDFDSDTLKTQIRDFKKRKELGEVETYELATGRDIRKGVLGPATNVSISRSVDSPTGWHIVDEEKNTLGLLKREHKGKRMGDDE